MIEFSKLPTPVKRIAAIAGITIGGGGGLLFFGPGFLVFLLVLVVLLALVVGGYWLWNAWQQKHRSSRIGSDLRQHSSASPRDIRDPGSRARLDSLRQKFEEGVAEYRARGKDLYRLPWYMIVGPSGSGKTEAIRHSNLRFPPRMQDPLQGVGGTINMHWWFTNDAVILDTAGRLIFEEVKAGETGEWKEFLQLLKRHRSRCPINGLVLTIGVDSLIRDTADEIARKAGRIAEQLDVIQRVLDVRFPVYVIVTKCDLLTGFRELFDDLTDPQLQHQIFGWSNPDPLDSPFRPELVQKYLDSVIQRLRRRCLGFLRDPSPQNLENRRIDEVDAVAALPHSFSLVGPRLRRYLETIFVAGEWSSKPLFLRGIYFTSSMREGSELDQALAEAIGLAVDDLPQGKIWDRERAYFLRDLFMEKIFREKGLVTRATNTSQMLRRRQLALYGSGFVALLAVGILSWFGSRRLGESVRAESELWREARKIVEIAPSKRDSSSAVVFRDRRVDAPTYRYGTNVVSVNRSLLDAVQRPFKVSAVFKPIAWTASGISDADRRRAQRLFLEDTVLRPLWEKTDEKLRLEPMLEDGPTEAPRLGRVLRGLLWTEVQAVKRLKNAPATPTASELENELLEPLLLYLLDPTSADFAVDDDLTRALQVTYSRSGDEAGRWPPRWVSMGTNLSSHTVISNALTRFLENVGVGLEAQANRAQISNVVQALKSFETGEQLLRQRVQDRSLPAAADFEPLRLAQEQLDSLLAKTPPGSAAPDGFSLAEAYQRYLNLGETNLLRQLRVAGEIADAGQNQHPEVPLFKEVNDALNKALETVRRQITEAYSAAEIERMKTYDGMYLAGLRYQTRWRLGAETQKLIAYQPDQGAALTNWQAELRMLKNQLATLGPPSAEFTNACAYFLDRAFVTATARLVRQNLRFPLLRIGPEDVVSAPLDVEQVRGFRDLFASAATHLDGSSELEPALREPFTRTVDSLLRVAAALLGEQDALARCTVVLPPASEQPSGWSRIYRRISLGDQPAVNADLGGELGALRVDGELVFRFMDVSGRELNTVPLGRWGPLELLHRYLDKEAPAPAADPVKVVKMPLKDPESGETFQLRLHLRFTPALPEPTLWPEAGQIASLAIQ